MYLREGRRAAIQTPVSGKYQDSGDFFYVFEVRGDYRLVIEPSDLTYAFHTIQSRVSSEKAEYSVALYGLPPLFAINVTANRYWGVDKFKDGREHEVTLTG